MSRIVIVTFDPSNGTHLVAYKLRVGLVRYDHCKVVKEAGENGLQLFSE
jgi:hypothetical protein